MLERIILASSNPGDLILDAFCGSGTAIAKRDAFLKALGEGRNKALKKERLTH